MWIAWTILYIQPHKYVELPLTPTCVTASHASPFESIVRLTIVDVGAVLRSTDESGEDHRGGEGEEGIGTPAGVCARVCA